MNCSQCHSLEPTSTDGLKGPALGLIYNRRVGSDKNYQAYSKEMLQSNFFWSAKNLYNFMYRPKDVISFTKCRLYEKGLTDESDRADLIMFLREYSHELGKNMRIRAVSEKGYDFYQT